MVGCGIVDVVRVEKLKVHHVMRGVKMEVEGGCVVVANHQFNVMLRRTGNMGIGIFDMVGSKYGENAWKRVPRGELAVLLPIQKGKECHFHRVGECWGEWSI